MRKRHAPRARERGPLNNAVMDQCIMDDDVVSTEQVANDGNVRRMPTDQSDAVLRPVDPGEPVFEIPMELALARYRSARLYRRPISVHSRLCSRDDMRMAVEPDVIVGREINVTAAVDNRLGARQAVVHAEERIGYA